MNSSLANHELSVIIGKIEAENKELNVENEKLSISKLLNGWQAILSLIRKSRYMYIL